MEEMVVLDQRLGEPVQQLGSKYLLAELLGRGAMGEVRAATTHDDHPLAVKVLRPELSTDDRTVARFLQERQIFSRIDHPNVVRVHDLVAEGDQLGIVMERVNGGDLKRRIRERSLTPSQAMALAAEVAAGLHAIHAVDVVHRDLKPANILIAEHPDGSIQPKISDFGISRLIDEAMTRTSSTIGTPLYMAPEAADQRGAEGPADIYALGVVMFEMLVGTAPFHEGSTFAVLRSHAMDVPPAIGGIPEQLALLIDHMLAKDPAARPDAAQVQQRIEAILPEIEDSISPIAIERVTPAPGVAGIGGLGGFGGVAAVGVADAATIDGTILEGIAPEQGLFDSPQQVGDPAPPPPWPGQLAGVGSEVLAGGAPPTPPGEPVPSAGAPLKPNSTNTGGSFLAGHRPWRLAGIGIAVACITAVAGVGFLTMREGGDTTRTVDEAAIGDDTDDSIDDGTKDGTTASITESDGSVGSGDRSGDGGGQATLTPTPRSDSSSDGSSDSSSDGTTNPTTATAAASDTTDAPASTTTTSRGASTTATTADQNTPTPTNPTTATTKAQTTSTTTAPTTTTTTAPTTTTTTAPTTTTTTAPTTTTTTAPTTTGTPIQIVSGPAVLSVGRESFHFNYTTNNVCGAGSFKVYEATGGALIGIYSGPETCYGPVHGGNPQATHSTFGGFNLQPDTSYRVVVTVKGTASDGSLPEGTGSDGTSFIVTTKA